MFVKSNIKKLLISFLASLIVLLSFAPYFPARAQTWYNQNPFEWYIKVYDPDMSPPNEIFGERYTAAQVQWVIYGVLSYTMNLPYTILGMNPSPNICLANLFSGTVKVDACLGIIPDFIKSIIARLTNLKIIAKNRSEPSLSSIWKTIITEDRPLSAITYVKNIGKKLSLVPEAKAADTWGFGNLSPILNIWKLTRNFAYFFFVLAIIIISFMIMFKVKISPQVVISIQSALPKIVIALVLVTFSYAIAGLLVDLLYVVLGLFAQFFGSSGGSGPMSDFDFLRGLFFGDNFISVLIYSVVYLLLYLVSSFFVTIFSLLSLNVTSVLYGIFLFIFIIGIFLILLWNILAGAFLLFKTLAMFYVTVIIGPIQIAMDAIPGMGGRNFSNWLKSLVSKLAVFAATGILWYLAFAFVVAAPMATAGCTAKNYQGMLGLSQAITDFQDLNNLIGPSGLGNFLGGFVLQAPTGKCWAAPFLGDAGGATGIAFLLISIGCIIAITKVPKQIESFMAGKGYLETGITEAMGPFGQIAGGAQKYGIEEGTRWAARRARTEISSRAGQRGVWGALDKGLNALSGNKPPSSEPKSPGDISG